MLKNKYLHLGWGTGSNQTLPPDASPIATPHFDVHAGRCPAIKFDCDNKPIRYYCVSDLTCFSFQKCCLYSCSYVCTIATTGGWKSADDANTGVALPGESSAPPADASVSVQKNELAEVTL